MTDPGYVHYVLIVDRSGSMRTIRDDTEGGIRAFIDRQLEGVDSSKRTASFYQFDTEHDCLHDFGLLADAKDYKLLPRGATALLDACGTAITRVGEKLAALPEDKRPGHVIVVIATDGQENSSREYTRSQVKEMITRQQDEYQWKFTYIGANQDAFAEAEKIGIGSMTTLYYGTATTDSAWSAVATASSGSTSPTSPGISYTLEQRKAAAGK